MNKTDYPTETPNTLAARKVIVAYSGHKTPEDYIYFEEGTIVNEEVTSTKPVSIRTLDKLSKCSEKIVKDKRELERNYCDGDMSNVLYCSEKKRAITWVRKAQPTYQHFSKNLKIKDGTYPTPNLVFSLVSGSFYVHAYKTDPKIRYKAPFFNVYTAVCMGSASFGKKIIGASWQEVMKIAEQQFFGSKFSHLGDKNPIKGNLSSLYRKMKDKPKFDNNVLIKLK